MGYICKNCHFRCDKSYQECPYCGKKTLEAEKSAEELLLDVGNLDS